MAVVQLQNRLFSINVSRPPQLAIARLSISWNTFP